MTCIKKKVDFIKKSETLNDNHLELFISITVSEIRLAMFNECAKQMMLDVAPCQYFFS